MGRIIKFFKNGLISCNDFVKFVFENCLRYRESTMFSNKKYIYRNLSCSIVDLLLVRKLNMRKKITTLLPRVEDWKIGLLKEITDSNLHINIDYSILNDLLKFICLEKLYFICYFFIPFISPTF